MGLFGFFSKKKVSEVREITFDEAVKIIGDESESGRRELKGVMRDLNGKVEDFVVRLRERVGILDRIDLKDKRESERIKILTLQGLKEYVVWLGRFADSLEKIGEEDVRSYIGEVELAISNFLRNSRGKLQRATILIGEDIVVTENLVKDFSREINRVIRDNVGALSKVDWAVRLRELEDSIVKVLGDRKRIKNFLGELEEKASGAFADKLEVEKELKDLNESEEFKDWKKKREGVDLEMVILRKEIERIKRAVDLKALLKKFHGVKGRWELIKSYRENFLRALEGDEGLEFIEVLEKGVAGQLI